MTSQKTHYLDAEPAPNTGARLTLWTGMIGIVVMLVWAGMSEIDQVTRSTGQVIASARTQVVQSPDGGVLRELKVREGDIVKAGQLLATLEKARVQAAVSDSEAKVAALHATLSRLRAEVYGTELTFDYDLKAYPAYIENQRNLFQKRRIAFLEDIAALSKVRKVSIDELLMNKQLLSTGDVSRADILRLERQIAEIDVQITSKRNKFFQDAQAEMTKAQEDLNTQKEALNDRHQLLEQTDLIAPADGVVKNIKETTLGSVVRPGDLVMEILPTGQELIVETKVYPIDIAMVRIGQQASVKLDAWDYKVFGGFKGKVIYVSPDTLMEEKSTGPVPYYRVQIQLGEQEFTDDRAKRIEVRPGMTVQVDILAMKRTVLSYLTNPVSKTFSQSMSQ